MPLLNTGENMGPLEQLAADVSEIKTALLGDLHGTPGLVNKMENSERRIAELERFTNKIKGVVSGMVIKITIAALTGGLITFFALFGCGKLI